MEDQDELHVHDHAKCRAVERKILEVKAREEQLRNEQDTILAELASENVEYVDDKKDYLRFIEKELTGCQARVAALQRRLEDLSDVSNN